MSLLTLPPETLTLIVEILPPADRVSLVAVCRSLHASQTFYVTLFNLRANVKSTVFCLDDNPDDGPCVLMDVTVAHEPQPALKVHSFFPDFMRGDDKIEGAVVLIEEDDVYLKYEDDGPGWLDQWSGSSEVVVRDWDMSCRGKLLRATGDLMRSWYRCPECKDYRCVCPGCGGFSMRWSELFASCGWDMPCPCCIGYEKAYLAKVHYREDH